MTDQQKSTLASVYKILIGAAVGALTTVATVGMIIGEDRSTLLLTDERSRENRESINTIHIQMAEERVRTSNIIDMLTEMKEDIKAIRGAQ